jgi:hypothetical protein
VVVFSELKPALRTVFRSPRYTLSVALILALGIGANSLVFSIIFAVLSKPQPFRDQDRIVVLWEAQPNRGITRGIIRRRIISNGCGTLAPLNT